LVFLSSYAAPRILRLHFSLIFLAFVCPFLQFFAVFTNGQPDNDEIQNGNEHQADGMGVGDADDLVDAEAAEDEDHQGIGPKAAGPKSDYEDQLGDPVRQQKNAGEEFAAAGEIASDGDEVTGHDVVAIGGKVVIAKGLDQTLTVSRRDEPNEEPAQSFDEAVESLEGNANLKRFVEGESPAGARSDFFWHV